MKVEINLIVLYSGYSKVLVSFISFFGLLQEEIKCDQTYKGARYAVQTFKGCLHRKKSPPQEFLHALRQVKLNDLADKLEDGR